MKKKSKKQELITRSKPKKEIQAEYLALEKLKKQVPHFTHLGEDNWEMITAQIQTLKWEYTLDQIDHWWPDKTDRSDGDCHGAAEDALLWMQNGDVPAPSSIWSRLVGRKNPKVVFTEAQLDHP